MAKILVVDDMSFLRSTLTELLMELGHEVVGGAENGIEAIDQYTKLRPDIVTMDIDMPVMEGVEAVKRICRFDPNAAIIMCYTIGQEFQVVDAFKVGAKEFVVKPFQLDCLERAINKLLIGRTKYNPHP